MDDLIYRKALMDELGITMKCEDCQYKDTIHKGLCTMPSEFENACVVITDAPSAEPGWIPVTERLPEEDGHYIVAVKNGLFPNNVIPIDILRYEGGKWKYYFVLENDGFEDDDFEDPITAWMPLPEAYQPGVSE